MVRENDLAELKEKILFLLDNEKVRSEFSKAAREDILRDASIEGMFQTFRNAVEFVYPIKGNTKSSNDRRECVSV